MSRITGSDAKKMFEAYAAVYFSEEQATEEQVAEIVEDIEQLDEMGQRMTTGQATAKPSTFKPTPGAGSAGGSGSGGRRGSGSSPGRLQMPASKPATPAPAPRPAAGLVGTAGAVARPAAPAAAAPKPSAAPSAGPKVAPTKATGTPIQQWTAKFPKLAAKVTPSGERSGTQMGTGQSTMSKQAAELRAMRERIASKPIMAQTEYDAYDVVLEYLIDNGHAETVDEAHYLMIEMDAQMIGDIVEAKYGTEAGRKELAKKIRKGEEIGKKGPGTGFAAVEKAAKKGGARDPKAVAAAAMWKTYGK